MTICLPGECGMERLTADILPTSFYARAATDVAPDLIGCVLFRRLSGHGADGLLAGRIVETEAYRSDDPASHSYAGRTRRNAAMFGPAGHAYVYRSHGVHWCLNVVTGEDGVGEAVLIRALEPLAGIELMEGHRGIRDVAKLCAGPGRLCVALAITGDLDGAALSGDPVGIAGPPSRSSGVISTTRIGISKGRDLNWRYCEAGSRFVSRPCRPTAADARR